MTGMRTGVAHITSEFRVIGRTVPGGGDRAALTRIRTRDSPFRLDSSHGQEPINLRIGFPLRRGRLADHEGEDDGIPISTPSR
jgi:hypothetical protein